MYFGKRVNGELVIVDKETRVAVSLKTLNEFASFASEKNRAERKKDAINMGLKNGVYCAVGL